MLDAQVHAREVRKRLWSPPNAIREEGEVRRLSDEMEKLRAELRASQHNLDLAQLTIQEQAEQLQLAGVKRAEPENQVARHYRQNTFKGVISAVSEHLGIGIREILSRSRLTRMVYARWLCFYVARNVIRLSLPEIGRRVGCDHTTALHGIRKIEGLLSTDPKVQADVDAIKARLA